MYIHICIYIYIYIQLPSAPPPPCPGLLGQTANKRATNKQGNQETKKARSQPTNNTTKHKATEQSTKQYNNSTTSQLTSSLQGQTPLKNRPKIHQETTKIGPKLVLEGVFGRSWGHLGASWRALGAILAPRRHQDAKNHFSTPPGRPKLEAKIHKNRPKVGPKSTSFFDLLFV